MGGRKEDERRGSCLMVQLTNEMEEIDPAAEGRRLDLLLVLVWRALLNSDLATLTQNSASR